MIGFCYGISTSYILGGVAGAPGFALAALAVDELSASGTVIADLVATNASNVTNWRVTGVSPANAIAVVGTELQRSSGALDFETVPQITATLLYDHDGGTESRAIIVQIVDEDEPPIMQAGSLSANVEASAGDVTAPTFAAMTPADDATGVAIDTTIVLDFSEAVVAGASGTFTLRNVTGATDVETFDIATDLGTTITIASGDVTLTPSSNLSNSVEYAIRWQAGVVEDAAGNGVAAQTGDTINFTTAAAPASSPPVIAQQSVVYSDTVNSNTTMAGSSVTIGSGANRVALLVAMVYKDSNGADLSTSTADLGGQSMTMLAHASGSQPAEVLIFGVAAPVSGARVPTVNLSDGTHAGAVGFVEITGADQAIASYVIDADVDNANTAISSSIACAVDDLLMSFLSVGKGGEAAGMAATGGMAVLANGGTGQTGTKATTDCSFGQAAKTITTAATETPGFTVGTSDQLALASIAIAAA